MQNNAMYHSGIHMCAHTHAHTHKYIYKHKNKSLKNKTGRIYTKLMSVVSLGRWNDE